ncbi:ABC transporter permease [Dyadobacter frigoris]|uniref:FtsX-like permease family protein n=1 Tax=Dyadobacter frigoris TaxID=2576211 RepID=A0A4U6D335_9BACT|nr:ABC transporter permease [Dyadobacter frigoris]TKT91690.1 FtsX-like permease family protein [Dyadobacter frigoris]GLU51744.1 ABC transporter permease [Dyadobacter frigoris]
MLKNYFKIALRNLQRSKAYAFINVLGLALGITCAVLIFMLVRYHLSFDTFHANSDRIYRIVTEFHNETVSLESGVPTPLGKAFRNDFAFAEKTARVITYDNQLISLPNSKDNKKFEEENGVAYVEPDFFDILNFPLLGGDKKSVLSEPNSAIVTQKIAEKYFGKTNAIGQVIRINNETNYKITGILKDLPVNTDRSQEIYLPWENLKDENPWLFKDDSWMGVYSSSNCFVLLKNGVTQATVEKSLPAISKKYYSAKNAPGWQFKLQPLSDIHFNAELGGYMEKKNLWALSFIGIFLIVTACVNFVNLATAQALSRSKEIGVRKVLGSLKSQLFWQFISETALITFFALLIGLILSYIALPYVNELFKAHLSLSLISDGTLVLFLLGLVVTVTFFSGSYPGLILAGFQPILALKGKISQKSAGGFTLRRGLVVTQFAISQILIIGTIVIANQMRFSKQSDLGFNKDAMVMLRLPVTDLAKMSTLKSRIMQLPGIKSGTFCFAAPAANSNSNTMLRYDSRGENEQFDINMKAADDQYIKTFGLKLVAGRNIMPSDTVREFVVNETLIKKLKLKSADEILGKELSLDGGRRKFIIVGVVKDFYNYSFRDNIDPICIMANYKNYQNFALNIDMASMKPTMTEIEKIWSETYPEYIFQSTFLDDKIAEFYALDSIMLQLIQFFAGVAIFIGCLGLYGLVSFMAAQKTKEIGVRKVLGASIGNIVWMFGKEFVRLLLVAFAIAAPLGWWVMNGWLQDFKYREEIGAGIFLLAIGATLLIAALTVGYRSISAALMDPVKSLKSE